MNGIADGKNGGSAWDQKQELSFTEADLATATPNIQTAISGDQYQVLSMVPCFKENNFGGKLIILYLFYISTLKGATINLEQNQQIF